MRAAAARRRQADGRAQEGPAGAGGGAATHEGRAEKAVSGTRGEKEAEERRIADAV